MDYSVVHICSVSKKHPLAEKFVLVCGISVYCESLQFKNISIFMLSVEMLKCLMCITLSCWVMFKLIVKH
jgi:hypothetical protein